MAAVWNPRALALLARADLLLLLAESLRPAPRAAARPDRTDPGGPRDDRAAHAADLARACGLDRRASRALAEAAALLPRRTAEHAAEYARLFEAGGVCPPNETAYVRRDKCAVLGDLCGFYRAFGFDPAPDSGEKADHVVTELQFIALLLVLAARAAGDPGAGTRNADELAVTLQAIGSFAADHLGEWLPSFATRLGETAELPLLRRTADLLPAAWAALGREVGMPHPSTAPTH
jgi:TorA maturation chaperone TorD